MNCMLFGSCVCVKKACNSTAKSVKFHTCFPFSIKKKRFPSQQWFKGMLDFIVSLQTQTAGFSGLPASLKSTVFIEGAPLSWILGTWDDFMIAAKNDGKNRKTLKWTWKPWTGSCFLMTTIVHLSFDSRKQWHEKCYRTRGIICVIEQTGDVLFLYAPLVFLYRCSFGNAP